MTSKSNPPLRAWLPAVGIMLASVIALPVLAAPTADPRMAAGVFPPWWDQARSLAAADEAGAVVAAGAAPFVMVVRRDDGQAAARLRAAGALLVLDPRLAGGCAP